jgi:hypothetical protein
MRFNPARRHDTMKLTTARVAALTLPLAAALAGVAQAGCRGGDPDCKAVGAAYASLQQGEIEKPSSAGPPLPGAASPSKEQKEQALSLIPLLKEAMVKECEEKKWSAETRRCVVAARTPDDLERCQTSPEEAEAPDEAAAEEPAGEAGKAPEAPAPAPKPESP